MGEARKKISTETSTLPKNSSSHPIKWLRLLARQLTPSAVLGPRCPEKGPKGDGFRGKVQPIKFSSTGTETMKPKLKLLLRSPNAYKEKSYSWATEVYVRQPESHLTENSFPTLSLPVTLWGKKTHTHFVLSLYFLLHGDKITQFGACKRSVWQRRGWTGWKKQKGEMRWRAVKGEMEGGKEGRRGRRWIHEDERMTCSSTGLHTCRRERRDEMSDSEQMTQRRCWNESQMELHR